MKIAITLQLLTLLKPKPLTYLLYNLRLYAFKSMPLLNHDFLNFDRHFFPLYQHNCPESPTPFCCKNSEDLPE